MLRRLFYLFPDEAHAQRVVDELVDNGVSERRIHAITNGIKLKTLPEATEMQRNDMAFKTENFLWHLSLSIFAFAFLILIAAIVTTEVFWVVFALLIMLATFIAGEYFVIHIPHVHLSEFNDALSHGEILLMIDIPRHRLAEIEHMIHHHHPEAFVGGVSWSTDAFGI